jgi:hypothetical protein
VRDCLGWAVQSGRCAAYVVPVLVNNPGVATDPEQRWSLVARMLHENILELTDRVAGAMLLLYGGDGGLLDCEGKAGSVGASTSTLTTTRAFRDGAATSIERRRGACAHGDNGAGRQSG